MARSRSRGCCPEFAGDDVPVTFERLALTPAQILAMNLPTREVKRDDAQAAAWEAKSLAEIGEVGAVELDAIPLPAFKGLIENAITPHIEENTWAEEEAIEAEERRRLQSLRLEVDDDS